jgi:hypothetical protein
VFFASDVIITKAIAFKNYYEINDYDPGNLMISAFSMPINSRD